MRTVLGGLAVVLLAMPVAAYPGGPIVLYGDSRALGAPTNPADSITGYWNAAHPDQLMLQEAFGGRTTVEALKNVRDMLHRLRPGVVVVLIDVNDHGLLAFSPEQTARNLWQLARVARTHQTEVYVLSTSPVAWEGVESNFSMVVEAREQAWPYFAACMRCRC